MSKDTGECDICGLNGIGIALPFATEQLHELMNEMRMRTAVVRILMGKLLMDGAAGLKHEGIFRGVVYPPPMSLCALCLTRARRQCLGTRTRCRS